MINSESVGIGEECPDVVRRVFIWGQRTIIQDAVLLWVSRFLSKNFIR